MKLYYDYEINAPVIECSQRCKERRCKYFSECQKTKEPKLTSFIHKVNKVLHCTEKPILWSRPEIYTNLSGTKLCPRHMKRIYTCKDCKFHICQNKEFNHLCICKNRNDQLLNNNEVIYNEAICEFFEISDFSNNWSRDTGEYDF